jgi:hypothetical protein
MSLEAARLFLAAGEARAQQYTAVRTAEESTAREIEDDGGLVAYAQRIARRRDPNKAAPMHHLAPIAARCEAAERAMRGQAPPVYAVMHAAVQHGKSSLLQAFILRTLRRNPRARIGYASYAKDIAEERTWVCRELAHGEGIRVHPSSAKKSQWHTVEGGYVRAGGVIGGQWTGYPFDIFIIDDPYSGPEQADSAAHRAKVEAAIDQKILTRGYETMSVLLNTARWGPNDISAFFIRAGWPYICLPAIRKDEHGVEHALWPEVVPLHALLAKRDGRPARDGQPAIKAIPRRTWASLYQGRPQADGSRIFDPSHLVLYDRLPDGPYLEAIGIDVAYGAKARHDRSALVAWRRYVNEPRALYLAEAWIGHEVVEMFACRVAAAQIRRSGGPRLPLPASTAEIEDGDALAGRPPWRSQLGRPEVKRARRTLALWYASGTEAGGASVLRSHGANVHVVPAGIDKLARAQGGYVDPEIGGFTSTWSEGRIRWPLHEDEHVQAIRVQHEDFTGATSDDDDGVDATVAGHDAVQVQEIVAHAQQVQASRAQEMMRRSQPQRAPDGGRALLRW